MARKYYNSHFQSQNTKNVDIKLKEFNELSDQVDNNNIFNCELLMFNCDKLTIDEFRKVKGLYNSRKSIHNLYNEKKLKGVKRKFFIRNLANFFQRQIYLQIKKISFY